VALLHAPSSSLPKFLLTKADRPLRASNASSAGRNAEEIKAGQRSATGCVPENAAGIGTDPCPGGCGSSRHAERACAGKAPVMPTGDELNLTALTRG
jgi:hypothetical protein